MKSSSKTVGIIRIIGALFLAALVTIAPLPSVNLVSAETPSFGSTSNLSNNAGLSTWARTAVSGSNVYVAWNDNTPGNYEILFKRSTDNGATFGAEVNLSNTSIISSQAHVAAFGNNVYVVWIEYLSDTNSEIFFRRSADNGVTFGPAVNLSNTLNTASRNPTAAASGSNVYVAWIDVPASLSNSEIFFKRSLDNGATFSAPTQLSFTPFFSSEPSIAVSGSNVYVAWSDNENNEPGDLHFRRSLDNGATFEPVLSLGVVYRLISRHPHIAASGANVYVVWTDYDNVVANPYPGYPGVPTPYPFGVRLRVSQDAGATFGSATTFNISEPASWISYYPHLWPRVAASDSNVYLVMDDIIGGNREVFFRQSINGGTSFSAPVNLSNNAGTSIFAYVAASSVYVTWEDDTPGN